MKRTIELVYNRLQSLNLKYRREKKSMELLLIDSAIRKRLQTMKGSWKSSEGRTSSQRSIITGLKRKMIFW